MIGQRGLKDRAEGQQIQTGRSRTLNPDRIAVLVFLGGVLALVFLGGIAVGRLKLFPYPQLNAGWDAATDWRANWREYLGVRPKYLQATTRTAGGVTVYDRARAFPGYTLAATYLPEHSEQFDAYLLDMGGKVVHRWNASARRIFPENPIAQRGGGPGFLEIHGVHLYDNGDLVVSLGGQGAAKLDRCGQVLWRITEATHHHVEPLPDGSVLIPDHVKRYAEQADRPRVGLGPSGFYLDDRLLHIDRDGHVINEKSVIDILFESGWESLLFSGPGRSKMVREEDPTHLNDVEALPAEMASAFPMFNAGDLMMSFRHVNTVLVVEPKNWHVKWAMTGPWLMQHDPDFLPNGHILVYDNRVTGAKPVLGNTRLVEVDPATKQIVRIFEGKGEEAFYASERGEQQRLPNGDLLLVDPFGGRLVEIAPDSGYHVVWEWVNLVAPGSAGMITDTQRIGEAAANDWVGRPCDGVGVAASQ
jgi:hypothetical protein